MKWDEGARCILMLLFDTNICKLQGIMQKMISAERAPFAARWVTDRSSGRLVAGRQSHAGVAFFPQSGGVVLNLASCHSLLCKTACLSVFL